MYIVVMKDFIIELLSLKNIVPLLLFLLGIIIWCGILLLFK